MAIKVSGTTVIDDSRNLKNLGNFNTTGNVYANTFIGDAGQLTNLSGGDVGLFTATTSGSMSSGDPVVLNTDGTVSSINSTEEIARLGSESTPHSSNPGGTQFGAGYDPTSNKLLATATGNGTTYVGTVGSDLSITWGSGSGSLPNSATGHHYQWVYDAPNDQMLLFYSDSNGGFGDINVIEATISGTSLTFASSATTLTTDGGSDGFKVAYDTSRSAYCLAYNYQGGSTVQTKKIEYNGSSFTIQSAASEGSSGPVNDLVYDASIDMFVMNYQQTDHPYEQMLTVLYPNGNYYSYGEEVDISGTVNDDAKLVYDPDSQKTVLLHSSSSGGPINAHIVTTTGTGSTAEPSLGTATIVSSLTSYARLGSFVYDPDNKIITGFIRNYNTSNNVMSFKVNSDGTITDVQGSIVQYYTGVTNYSKAVYDTASNKLAVVYIAESHSSVLRARMWRNFTAATNRTSTNFLGISGGTYSNNVTANVHIKSAVSTYLSGLTPGQAYYAQDNGTLQYQNYNISGRITGFSFSNYKDTQNENSQMYSGVFNNDGTKFYGMYGENVDSSCRIYQYSLSTAYDVSTMTYDSVSFATNPGPGNEQTDLAWNSDGTKLFVLSHQYNRVGLYNLSSGFDLSTASYSYTTKSVSGQSTEASGLIFNPAGTRMYITDDAYAGYVYQYDLSTAFDISTASYNSVSFQPNKIDATGTTGTLQYTRSIAFNSDGTKMYAVSRNQSMAKYTLSTAYDISTASFELYVDDLDGSYYANQDQPRSILLNPDETKFFIKDRYNLAEYNMATGTLSTTSFAGTSIASNKLIVQG